MLENLEIKNGEMTPRFDPYNNIYSVKITDDITKLEIEYLKKDNIEVNIIGNDLLNEEDSELLERLGDISYMFEQPYYELEAFEINKPTTYLVEDNNKFVAFIYLYVRNNILLIYLGVLKEERGKHYSTNINIDITDYILDNFDIDYIRVCIDEDNIGSIKAVTNAGFIKEEDNNVYYVKRKQKGR